jgi:hypothetical protein
VKWIAVTTFEVFEVTCTDSLARVVPTASISIAIGPIDASAVTTAMGAFAAVGARSASGSAQAAQRSPRLSAGIRA